MTTSAREQVVDGHAVFSKQPADAAAQCESADPGLRDDAARDCKAEEVRFAVQVAQSGATLNSHGRIGRIHMDRPHSAKIDNQAVVAKGAAAHIMASAADSGQQTVCPPEIDGIHDIRDSRAACDDLRMFVYARIPNPAGVIVAGVLGFDHLAAKRGLERLEVHGCR